VKTNNAKEGNKIVGSMLNQFRKSKIGNFIWPLLRKLNEKKRIKAGKQYLEESLDQMKIGNKHIFYCGVCETSNMGDIAQTYCTIQWLKRYYSDYGIVLCRTSVIMEDKLKFLDLIKGTIKPNDIIVFQSGYNTHDIDGYEDYMHQRIIRTFPDNEIIMLPQTVYFISKKRKKLCSQIYNAHKKMLFLARDYVSEELARDMFPQLRVMLFPDIVTSLIGYTENQYQKREGIYLCRRHDAEQFYSEEDYNSFFSLLSLLDKTDMSDTIISDSNKEIYSNLQKYVERMINHFGYYKLVVTDKFHGLIFSLVANTPVIVLKTKDHKVISGYEWFSKIYPNTVYFADSGEQILTISKKILASYNYEKLDNYFDREYYQNLYKYIVEWEKSVAC